MRLWHQRLLRPVVALTVVVVIGLGVAPASLADGWARDRAQAVAYEGLDPAIRTAIVSRLPSSVAPTTGPVASSLAARDGFAWGAAAVGLLVGVAASCIALAGLTVVRHDGRLRSA